MQKLAEKGNFEIIDSDQDDVDYEDDFVEEIPSMPDSSSRVSPITGRTPFNLSGNFSNTAISPTQR